MNPKFYRFFPVAIMLILTSLSAFALDNSSIERYRSTIVRNNEGKVQKYSVLVANVGEPRTNSDFSEHFVQRVDPKYYQKGQIYLKTKAKTDNGKDNLLQGATALNSALQSIGSTNIAAFADAKRVEKSPGLKKYGLDRLYKISIPLDADPFEVCAELMQNPDVEYACPVSIEYSNEKPNDPLQDKQYTLTNMKVFEAWEYSKGSKDIKIAIVDSGTDYQHPDLAANIWTNPNEIPDDEIDNDGNGKIDDVSGWDFVANTEVQGIMDGDFTEDNDPINRANPHGTMVAGCASAVTNNEVGISGVGYNCKLIPVKVGSDIKEVRGLFRTYEAISYAADLGADIINCSFGGAFYNPMNQDVINYVVLEKNAVIVASAGNNSNNNDNFPAYPSSYKYVISVGATDKYDEMSIFSNYGYNVTTFAPGTDVFTTNIDGKYTAINGTSFSAPNVSGVVGLLKALHPNWHARKFYHQIRSTSDRISGGNKAYEFYGITNALKAVTWNSPNSNIKVPGISIEKFYLNGKEGLTTIKDYNEFTISFELKNYLSTTKNLKVKPFCADGVLEITDISQVIPEIAEDNSVTISFKAKLSEMNPWSDGYSKLVLEYEGENGQYSDYEMVKVPIKVPQEVITYTSKQYLDNNITYASASSFNDAWASYTDESYRGYAVRLNFAKNELKFFKIKPGFYTTAVVNTNNEDAFFAIRSFYNSSASIYKTYDAGSNFSEVEVSDITSKINAFIFKDDLNGVFFGNPKDGKWGIGITRNRGLKWTAAENPPSCDNEYEGMFSNAHEFVNNTLYFGTEGGKVYKSLDFGQNWETKTKLQGAVHSMAFIDENLGIAIHYHNNIAKFSLTGDGGDSWEVVYEYPVKELGESPVDIYADRRGRAFIVVYSDGSIYRTDDFAQTWTPIRKHRLGGISASSFYADNEGDVAVFQFGAYAERIYRKAKNIPEPVKPIITFKEGKVVTIDSVEVDKSKEVKLSLTNTGNGTGSISRYELKVTKGDNSEFELINSSPILLKPGANTDVTVKFSPKTQGEKEAVLTAKYGNSQVEIKIVTYGYVLDKRGTISIASGELLDFGNMEENTSKEITVRVSNNSNFDVKVFGVKISASEGGEDKVTTKDDKEIIIKANGQHDYSFVLKPTTIGKKVGNIEIENDGKVSPVKLMYTANVYKSTSVKESNVFANAKVKPNPASNSCQLILADDADKVEEMQIFSADGRLMMKLNPYFNNGIMEINTASLPSGQYSILLFGSGISETVKLIIAK